MNKHVTFTLGSMTLGGSLLMVAGSEAIILLTSGKDITVRVPVAQVKGV